MANLTDETLIVASRTTGVTLTADSNIPHKRVNMIVKPVTKRVGHTKWTTPGEIRTMHYQI